MFNLIIKKNDGSIFFNQNKEEGKDEESIQLRTTPDLKHHMGKLQKQKKTSHTRDPRGQFFFQQVTIRLQETEKTI